jgi:hypothetical protein
VKPFIYVIKALKAANRRFLAGKGRRRSFKRAGFWESAVFSISPWGGATRFLV